MLRHGTAALSLLYLAAVLSFHSAVRGACPPGERESLLSFFSNVSGPAGRPLRSWSPNNSDCCRWEGVSCGADGSVARLWLPERGLGGTISSANGLERLLALNLSHNSLSGALPPALLWSDHIVVLDVSYNRFSGHLPPPPAVLSGSTSTGSRSLRSLNISSNLFSGELPPLLDHAPDLRAVNASNNTLTGPIPIDSSICGVSRRLGVLDFSRNRLDGKVPGGLGNCSELVEFDAGFNNLSGPIPDDLYDAVGLQRLSLTRCQLNGSEIPWGRVAKLVDLVSLDLGGTGLQGELTEDVGKLSNLEELRLAENHLTGTVPSALGNCSRLRHLDLRGNRLAGNISAVDFSLFPKLSILDLGDNHFVGEFPTSIYSCRSLTALRLSNNSLGGRITAKMQNLKALSYLSLSVNKLRDISGTLRILGGCGNLTVALLAQNFHGKPMPEEAELPEDAFPKLRVLSLWGCNLTGVIPSWIARLGKLQILDLSGNQLGGTIPRWLGNLTDLFFLDLSDNLLTGEVISDITGIRALQSDEAVGRVDRSYIELPLYRVQGLLDNRLLYHQLSSFPVMLDLKNNHLNGTIPPWIGRLKRLQILDLSSNDLSGEIPEELSNLSNLETLNLSSNHLTGPIPPTLNNLHFLASFNVSFNNLSGRVPPGTQFDTFPGSSFEGNADLCGSVLRRPCTGSSDVADHGRRADKRKAILVMLFIVAGVAFFSVAFLAICALSWKKRRKTRLAGDEDEDVEATFANSSISSAEHIIPATDAKVVMLCPSGEELKNHLTISDIVKATDNFHEGNIVGCGGFGLVYKASLPDGSKLAIKRLAGDTGLMEREFVAEVEALSAARHENLVALQGYYVNGGFRLLLYSYMENGSLDYWLHEADEGPAMLDWPARLRIARGVSRGLSYIHQVCKPRIIHRDIKSGNILLDGAFEAYLADFGLSRLVLPQHTHVTTELVGTLGYIPPEYGQGWVATKRGDMYSFGVVLLELLTGRRPIDPFVAPQQSGELVLWVQQMKRRGELEQVIDPGLRGHGFEEDMLRVLEVACICVDVNPLKRPTIQEVVGRLAALGVDQPAPEV